MWRQARGAGLRGALPCGMRSGLLCAVLCAGLGIAGACAHCSDPPLLCPVFPSFQPLPPPSLWAPACAPGVCMAGLGAVLPWVLQSEVFSVPGFPRDSKLTDRSATVPLQLPRAPGCLRQPAPPHLASEC